jgi:two-component system, cell cycle sensor histidine kinase and response regulator CckA
MQADVCRKRIVLAIDDEPAIRSLLKSALPAGGFDVLLAASGIEGIEVFKLRHEEISIVLLDVCMPGLSGIETCKRLRELDAAVPVCFMTGYNSDEINVQLSKLHVPILQKPFNLPALLATLNGLINARTLLHAD